MTKTTLPSLKEFILNLRVGGYSPETIYNYERDINIFADFISSQKIPFHLFSKEDLLIYKDHLYKRSLSARSINRLLSSLKSYFKYLISMDRDTPISPDAIIMSKLPKTQKNIPNLEEIKRIVEAPSDLEKNKQIGLRNRTILEILFSTGMRISEVVNISISNIQSNSILIMGKGRKQRYVYLTERAKNWLNKYLSTQNTGYPQVFDLTDTYIQGKIKEYRERLGITSKISAHTLRHGFATYLAEKGANPAAIQILLGHESLDTTTRYVHASDRFAAKEHELFHPLQN